jgi:Flp pilus assembly protein TadB
MNQPALLAGLALVGILAVAWLSATVAERRRRDMQGQLAAVLTATSGRNGLDGSVALRRASPTGRRRGLWLLPGRLYLAEELGATGDRLRIVSLVLAAFIGALLAVGIFAEVLQWPPLVTTPIVLAAGVAAANARLRFAQRRFQRQFVDRFPDALDVIVRAVRAGLPVIDAMESAAGSVSDPVGSEFSRVIDELRIGVDLEELLERVAGRIRVNDFRFFAATLVLQRRTGGSLAETLSNLAGLIRRRKEVRLKARALSAESRATAYLLSALPITIGGIVYLINPGVMLPLFTDPRGKVMLSIAIAMLVVGFAMMKAMIKKASQ